MSKGFRMNVESDPSLIVFEISSVFFSTNFCLCTLLIFKCVIDIRYNSCTARSCGVAWFKSAEMALLPWGESPHC